MSDCATGLERSRAGQNPSAPINGTKRQGVIAVVSNSAPCRRSSVSVSPSASWPAGPATGTTIRPPSASCATRAGGGAGSGGVDGDRVEGAAVGDAATAVTDHQLDVVGVAAAQVLGGEAGEAGVALDADHVLGQASQEAGRVAGAGADLEHALIALEFERLKDRGDDPGLGDGLLGADRQRRVGVGELSPTLGHEVLPRDRAHRLEHALVLDPPLAQLLLHHPRSAHVEVGHLRRLPAAFAVSRA